MKRCVCLIALHRCRECHTSSRGLQLMEMIEEADRDGDGEINEEEFLRIMKKTNLY